MIIPSPLVLFAPIDESATMRGGADGIMVNYLYDPQTIESNHQAFVNDGTVMCSADVDALLAAEHISAPNSEQLESQAATGGSAIESHELKLSK
jgi:hypothetical protein